MNRKIISIFFSLIISLFLAASVLAQEESQETMLEETQEQSDMPQEKIITDIEIEGNTAISTSTILAHIRSKPGRQYSSKALSEDLKNLYNLGFFEDIQMDLEETAQGIKVILQVKERKILDKILLEGNRVLNDERIRKVIEIKTGEFIDMRQLNEDLVAIEELYEKYGYSFTGVEYKLVETDENKVDLYLLIDEGSRTRITRITVKGNKRFSDGKILQIIKTKRKWLFNPGTFKKEVLEEDMERIASFYKRNGYLDAQATYDATIDTKKKRIYIEVFVTEGTQYYIGNVEIAGNENISNDRIFDAITLKKDSVFNQEMVEADAGAIQELYFEKGYIFSRIKPITSLDEETGEVNITYNIAENEIAYVDKIKVRGNEKTKDIVIRRELRILPGEKFDGAKLRRSRERLINLGFFEEVNYNSEPGSGANKRDLVVEVKEAKTGEISFGAGYSTVDSFVGFVEVAQKNFDWRNWETFTGAGQDLRFRASWGTIRKDYLLSFTEPWIFNRPISFGFDAFYNTHDRETDVGYAFDEERLGGDIRLGKEFSEYIRGSMIYKIENVDISDIDPDASSDLRAEEGDNVISSLTFGLTRDSRDNIYSPTRGSILGVTLGVAGGPLMGDKDFTRVTAKATKYFNPFDKLVLELSARAGLVDSFGDSDSVPIYERFYAGGANTIRGYEERKVGPIDSGTGDPLGGEAMLILNVEAVYPLFNFLKGAVFYDTGNVWSKASDFASGDFKSAIGLGVRIKTPIGPVKLDYGWPLDDQPGEEDKEGRFHFSMSHGF